VRSEGVHLAAVDHSTFQCLLADCPDVPRLTAAGKIVQIRGGTRCRWLWRDSHSQCRGTDSDFPVRVQLEEGPHRGAVLWMCFEDITWPLHPFP
jgi:hypothetical protein